MAKKTTTTSKKRSSSSKQTGRNPSKTKPASSTRRNAKRTTEGVDTPKRAAAEAVARASKRVPPATEPKTEPKPSPAATPAWVEGDIAAVMESLDQQLQAAVTALRELGGTSSRKGEAATGAASLNHMTALFQRLVSDAVEEQLADTLPALVALRGELAERLSDRPPTDSTEREFYERTAGALDQVLAGTGVREYDARPGEAFDPLIHTAVGETHRDDLGDAVVSEWLRPGYRTARGKVISPARVRVNRR